MIISAQNIHKSYTNKLGKVTREVLKDLSFEVNQGEKIALTGPSGSGKTTLLNLLAGFDFPDSGEISVLNQKPSRMNTSEILNYRNKIIGFVFQFHHLLPQCTLLENILLPTLPDKNNRAAAYDRALELIEYMGISEQKNNKPGELSGGECQRAAVARALINKPKILLADEPTGSLDEKNANSLIQLLCNINSKMNITLVIASHSHEIALKMDKVYKINQGQLNLADL